MRRKVIVGLLVLVAALAMAVVERERPFLPEPRDEAEARRLNALARVILITLDGPVRDDVLTGPQLVGLQRVIERSGVVLRATTTSPMALSLPGYQALAAGAATDCRDNDCARISVETMGERLARRLSLRSDDVAVFASWSRLARAASSRDGVVHVDAPADQPPREPGPPWRNARWDEETFTLARAWWAEHHPRFLHLAFLDTDEWAHADRRAEYEGAARRRRARAGGPRVGGGAAS